MSDRALDAWLWMRSPRRGTRCVSTRYCGAAASASRGRSSIALERFQNNLFHFARPRAAMLALAHSRLYRAV